MQQTLSIVGAWIIFCAHVPLWFGIVKKTVRPSFATWLMWTVMISVTIGTQVAAGKTDPWGLVGAAAGMTITTIFLLFYGEKKWTRLETKCALLALCAMTIWALAGPLWAQVASLAAFLIAGWPTVKSAYKHPENESTLVWGMFTFGFALTVIAVRDWSAVVNWLQPVVSTLFNLLLFKLAWRRPVVQTSLS